MKREWMYANVLGLGECFFVPDGVTDNVRAESMLTIKNLSIMQQVPMTPDPKGPQGLKAIKHPAYAMGILQDPVQINPAHIVVLSRPTPQLAEGLAQVWREVKVATTMPGNNRPRLA